MIHKIIKDLELNRREMNISKESIEFISIICKSLKPKNILEIGTFNGYSALWLSLYAENVTCLEIDPISINTAKENFKKADAKNIKIIQGDAVETIQKLKERFDIILIDAMKSQYKIYLELSLNKLIKNGIIFVDNTISHKDKLQEFFNYLKNSKLYYKELNLGKGLMIIAKNI